jgi:hypothetical protein
MLQMLPLIKGLMKASTIVVFFPEGAGILGSPCHKLTFTMAALQNNGY